MRISLVCPYAWDRPGGVQSHIGSLGEALGARGHEVQVIAPRMRRVDDPRVTVVGRAISVPANGSMAPVAFGPRATSGVRDALKRFAPNVVHLHEPLIPSLSLLAVMSGRHPAVGTFHASAERSVGYRAAKPVLRHAAARLTARTAVSDAARALVVRYFPGDYALTPNGIDRAPFLSAEPVDLGPGRHIIFLGRLERRKGAEILIQAMTRFRGTDVDLVVAGAGPEEGHLKRLAAQLEVPARFLGRVTEREKARLLKAADVYCAPNLGGESFGIVLVEAMAAGAPVVCSSLPAFGVVTGGSAILVEPGEQGLLADALKRVLDDAALSQRMRKKGAQVSRAYDWGRLVANVESIYEGALEMHR